MKKKVMMFGISFCLVSVIGLMLFLYGCAGGGGSGDSIPGGGLDTVAPVYNLSGDQEQIVKKNGQPGYFTLSVNSESGRREESWIYPGQQKKMYIFWDGVRVSEKDIDVSPNAYSITPNINSINFTKDTTKEHITTLYGDQYILSDQSTANFKFETWYYKDIGLSVSFFMDKLVVVQTVDKPQ